ncbi:hypothetical protein LP415_14255 [Polaromonas sp. P1(28)-8]|nr:hypothetical protein LP415_14255 [Polaromonas sp. P1(28)-8]
MNDGRLVLVSQAGHVLIASPDLRKTADLKIPLKSEVLGAVSSGPKSIVLARLNGVGTIEIGDYSSRELSSAPPTK